MNRLPWKFIRSDVATAPQEAFNDTAWRAVTIPHDFNGGSDGANNDVLRGPMMYRGIGWYRVKFPIDAAMTGKRIFLEFEAVSLVADVYLNGMLLGQHKGGYTGFSFDITAAAKVGAENVLAVKANSANDPTVAPWGQILNGLWPRSYDYALYGGIYRNVWLTATNPVRIEAVFNDTPQVQAASSLVRVRTEVKNYDTVARTVSVVTNVLDAAGAMVTTMTASQPIAPGQLHTFDQMSASVPTPHLWSPGDPYLYKVSSTLMVDGQGVDQVDSPLGFRWLATPKTGPYSLNGARFPLRGVNRHQDKLGRGYALTDEDHLKDATLIKDTGFNFVRHAHYPAAQAFAKACDQLGMLLWVEIPMTVSISTNPAFLVNVKAQLTEMIRENYNHPSIFLWGLGNEVDFAIPAENPQLSEAYSNRVLRELNETAHALDRTRPTVGCNFKFDSNQALVDVYSPQHWGGWYSGPYVGSLTETEVIGEYGSDSEITRHREPGAQVRYDWSQEYAALLHEYNVAESENRRNAFPGYATFAMFDFMSPRADRTSPNTIQYVNQKGLVTGNHEGIKDVLYFYKSFLTDGRTKPMVYIVSHTWLDRWTAPAARDVWAYSNCEEVRLFNGMGTQPFGPRRRTDGEHPTVKTRFMWRAANVRFNVLYAECVNGGQVVATDRITLRNLPAPPP